VPIVLARSFRMVPACDLGNVWIKVSLREGSLQTQIDGHGREHRRFTTPVVSDVVADYDHGVVLQPNPGGFILADPDTGVTREELPWPQPEHSSTIRRGSACSPERRPTCPLDRGTSKLACAVGLLYRQIAVVSQQPGCCAAVSPFRAREWHAVAAPTMLPVS